MVNQPCNDSERIAEGLLLLTGCLEDLNETILEAQEAIDKVWLLSLYQLRFLVFVRGINKHRADFIVLVGCRQGYRVCSPYVLRTPEGED